MEKAIIEKNENWYTVKELCELCNVTPMSFTRFKDEVTINTDVIRYEMRGLRGNVKTALYSESVLKEFQAWLMRNQANQGHGSEVVKQATEKAVKQDIAITTIIQSGNTEALKCLFEHYMAETEAVAKNKLLEQKNQQLQIELDSSKEWYSVKRMEKLNPDKEFKWTLLKKESARLGKEVKKVFDQNYGEVNSYHISVWESLYFDSINYE